MKILIIAISLLVCSCAGPAMYSFYNNSEHALYYDPVPEPGQFVRGALLPVNQKTQVIYAQEFTLKTMSGKRYWYQHSHSTELGEIFTSNWDASDQLNIVIDTNFNISLRAPKELVPLLSQPKEFSFPWSAWNITN